MFHYLQIKLTAWRRDSHKIRDNITVAVSQWTHVCVCDTYSNDLTPMCSKHVSARPTGSILPFSSSSCNKNKTVLPTMHCTRQNPIQQDILHVFWHDINE